MKYSLCIDLLYLEIGENGPIFSNTEKLLAGMELASKVGYRAVEFWDWNTRDWQKLLAKKKELNLDVVALCAKDRGTLADPATHEKAIQGLRETIEVAKQFDCKNIIVVANNQESFTREESHTNIVAGLKKLAKIAEAGEVTLILEPIVGSYFVDSKEPFAIVAEVGSSNLKILYDIFHYQMMEGNICNTLKKYIKHIGHIHAAGVPERNEITEGELNYTYILKELKKYGYEGYFGIEYRSNIDKEESVTRCKEIIENV